MTTMTTTITATTRPKPAKETIALRFQLANLRDELELFGWRPEDTARYARQALTALPLADDQLDHTLTEA